MASYEKALSEIIDVLAHLVHVNVRWNIDLNKDEALTKLDSARRHIMDGDADAAIEDVVNLVKESEGAVTSGE